jgi:predicted RNA binding protein YcfA (HicA-like mRNA interferase family)
MKPKELLKQLNKDGWVVKHQVGSHIQLVHPSKAGKVIVPYHNKDLDIKTVNSILKQAGLK